MTDNVVKFPMGLCTSCGSEARDLLKIELVNFDSGEAAGTKYLCHDCRPLDEDRLRLLLDERDAEIERLKKENFSFAANLCQHPAGDEHGHFYCTEIDRLTKQLVKLKAELAREKDRADGFLLAAQALSAGIDRE